MLEISEVIQIIKQGKSEKLIDILEYEGRIRLHSMPNDNYSTTYTKANSYEDKAFVSWLAIAKDILPSDKYQTFITLLSFPLYSVDLVESAYNELVKVFDGQDASELILADMEEVKEDFKQYRKKINEFDFWQGSFYDAFKFRPSSYIVVDIPAEQETELPEPYFFIINTEYIHAVKDNKQGNNEYLIYCDESDKKEIHYYQVDDAFYRHFTKRNNKISLVSENQHDLGYSPANCLVNLTYNDNQYKKRNIISNSLGKLDDILFNRIIQKHLNLYAGFPIISTYEQICDYRTQNGLYCDHGILHIHDEVLYEQGQRDYKNNDKCPQCSNRHIMGPGTTLEVPIPKDSTEKDLMPSVSITTGDVQSIEQMSKTMVKDREEFYFSTIGMKADILNSQAVNKDQIANSIESRRAVIMKVKTAFEKTHTWLLNTLGKLRYGARVFQGAYKNYGTKFHLLSASELQENYKLSKENGTPVHELEQMRDDIVYKKYKNNPSVLRRAMILDKIEPYKDMTFKEIFDNSEFLNKKKIMLKYNFNDFVDKFEVEHGNIESIMIDNIDEAVKKVSDYMYNQIEIMILEQRQEQENTRQQSQQQNILNTQNSNGNG